MFIPYFFPCFHLFFTELAPRRIQSYLRKSTQGKFDKTKEDDFSPYRNKSRVKEEGEYGIDKEGLEELDHDIADDGSGTERVGENNFTSEGMMSDHLLKLGFLIKFWSCTKPTADIGGQVIIYSRYRLSSF